MMNPEKIAFIGGGNMATSLVGGVLQQGYPPAQLAISEPDLTKHPSLQALGVSLFTNNTSAIVDADVLILAVKPAQIKTVAQQIAPQLPAQPPLIISIAAGIRTTTLQQWLGQNSPIVRAMPNTPALINVGATGLFANAAVSPSQKALASRILQAVGLTVWVNDEAQMDAVTALSGSGPAYFFLFMEFLEQQATALGLSAETSHQLALQTALGAAQMAHSSPHSLTTLRQQVTSPGGTTERAVQTLIQGGFEALIAQALQAAYQRAIELGMESV